MCPVIIFIKCKTLASNFFEPQQLNAGRRHDFEIGAAKILILILIHFNYKF